MAHADVDRKPLCQGRARNDRQPRASENQCNDGGMISSSSCDLLRWVSEQAELSPHLQGVLLRLARLMDASGALTLPQAQIAAAIGLGETQTRAAIKALVAAGVMVRKRRGAVGAGRQCDVLQANLERQHDNSGVSTVSSASDDNSEKPIVSSLSPLLAHDNREPSTVSRNDNSGNPPVDNSPRACIVHVGARAQTLNSNTSRDSSSSERVLPSTVIGRASSDRPPPPLWQRLADDVGSPWLDPNKSAGLVLKGGVIDSLAKAGADYDLDILPTVRRLIAAKRDPVHSWGYFVDAIRKATADRLAAETPMEIITPQEAKTYDHDRTRNTDPGVRRRQRSLLTDRLMRTIAEGH